MNDDYAICYHCGEVTEYSDRGMENDPNQAVECNHCGKWLDLTAAEFIDKDDAPTAAENLAHYARLWKKRKRGI
jgi:hypothetical protein